ncbi:MAG: hypothetical protein R6W82_06400 [bacterium]
MILWGAVAVVVLLRLLPVLPGYLSAAAVGDPTRLPVDLLAVTSGRVDTRFLHAARSRGIPVHVWTLNRAERMVDLRS